MPALLLHASDPLWHPTDLNEFIDLLHDLGLIGSRTPSDQFAEFVAGEKFLDLVMFLGCSPQIVLDPETAQPGQTVCRVRMLSYKRVMFISAKASPTARCPRCRAAIDLPRVAGYRAPYQCENCGNAYRLTDLDWRQSAGFGRCFVAIDGIYPQEALPTDKLLNGLCAYSRRDWKHFYI